MIKNDNISINFPCKIMKTLYAANGMGFAKDFFCSIFTALCPLIVVT